MRAAWLEQRDESWQRRLGLAPLAPLGWLYGGVAALHRGLFAHGLRGRRRLASRVVSVGNLVVGGAGKTPLAAWIAAGLHGRGHKVVLASRGHRRQDAAPIRIVSDGRRIQPRQHTAGDEPVLLAAHAPGVPVLVGRDRGLVGLRALSAFDADVLVLDDGFQHHRLARDVDLVTFDGALGFGNGRVLPRGPLREPARALRGADAVAAVDGPLAADDESRVRALAPKAHRIQAARRPLSLRPLAGGPDQGLVRLAGLRVGMLAGTALPESFRRTLEGLGAEVVAERIFPDHHPYQASDLRGLDAASVWITTEKDALKIVPWWVGVADLRVLRITLEVDHPGRTLDWLESQLRAPQPVTADRAPRAPGSA